MQTISATDARKEWSTVIDTVVRERPQVITRTHDSMWFSTLETMKDILDGYQFTADKYVEPDMTITLSMRELDIIEHGATEEEAKIRLAKAVLEYAEDFYDDFAYWSKAKNRKSHVPYVFKALIAGDEVTLEREIICQDGKKF